jgi:drug/metabolite transporter (DMT)-like permease
MKVIIQTFFTALCFGAWPLVAKKGAVPAQLLPMGMFLTGTICAILYLLVTQYPIRDILKPENTRMLVFLFFVGVLNFTGMVFYGTLIANNRISISTVIVTVGVLVPVVSYFLDVLLLGGTFSWYKILGVLMACGAVILMNIENIMTK